MKENPERMEVLYALEAGREIMITSATTLEQRS
jgi:hypothetical protein